MKPLPVIVIAVIEKLKYIALLLIDFIIVNFNVL